MFRRSPFEEINAQGFYTEFLQRSRPHLLVDVRTSGEFASGHIPGAVNIPLNVLEQRLIDLPHSKPVIVVCQTGNRSINGAKILMRAGFHDVYNFVGGTSSWQRQGFDLER